LIVVDASVAAKWVLEEAGTEQAVAILQGGEPLAAPELLQVEGAGAVTRAFRNGRIDAADAADALGAWFRTVAGGAVELSPNRLDLPRAAELSCAIHHPLNDCLYLALAERLGAELVTADAAFARRAPAAYPRVRLLGAPGA
jgi:predicted nucleic acid-binding protein